MSLLYKCQSEFCADKRNAKVSCSFVESKSWFEFEMWILWFAWMIDRTWSTQQAMFQGLSDWGFV